MRKRTQRINKQKMYYSLPGATVPIYETDEDGNIIYITALDGVTKIPKKTSDTKTAFSEPKLIKGAIFSQLENAIVRAWGNDTSKNYAVLVVGKNEYPDLVNGARLWRKSKIKYNADGTIDESSADYVIQGVLDEELNEDSYYLQKLDGDVDGN